MPYNERPLLSIGPFIGLDATSAPYYTDPSLGTDMTNVVPNRKRQSYITAKGRTNAFSANFPAQIRGFFKFNRNTGASAEYLGVVDVAGPAGAIYAATSGGSPTALTLPTALSASHMINSFAAYQQWAFFTNNADTPLKIDQLLNVTRWGITAPAGAPTAAAGAAGNLNGQYAWVVTFGNASMESSPSPISNTITLTNQQANLTAIPVSTDSQVTVRNIYRIGGLFGTFLLVGTINDNTTTTFTDNVADLNITGQQLELHRDPPQSFFSIAVHKDRVWGFGYTAQPSDLWYSNFAEPWGFDNTNGVIPVGRNQNGDDAVMASSTGSALVLNKTHSLWVLYGDSPNDFVRRPIANIGCVSRRSVTVGTDGKVYWIDHAGKCWRFDGFSAPEYISGDIKGIIEISEGTYAFADLSASVGMWYDDIWLLSFPTRNITFGYNTLTGKWHKYSWATDIAVYDPFSPFGPEVTAAIISGSFNNGAVSTWFSAETDLGNPITSTYTSYLSDGGQPSFTKTFRHVVVVAPVQANASATLTVTVDPGPNQKQATKIVNLGQGPYRRVVSLPPTLVGFTVQVSISVTSSAQTEIQKIEVHGGFKRSMVAKG